MVRVLSVLEVSFSKQVRLFKHGRGFANYFIGLFFRFGGCKNDLRERNARFNLSITLCYELKCLLPDALASMKFGERTQWMSRAL